MATLPTGAAAQTVTVVDGDTIEIGATTYRLKGIDAPEHGQKCNRPSGSLWPCGKHATRALQSLVEGADLRCVGSEIDDYGRTIATCFDADLDLNKELVLKGLAWAFLKYSTIYEQEQKYAKSMKVGIWQADTQPAWEFRAERWLVAQQEAPNGCPIKGNISKQGRIYHAPWSPWYSRTSVNLKHGEKWFCDESEAKAAGWRAPKWGRE